MKKYFVTGLLIWIPLAITFMVIAWIVSTLDRILLWIPEHWQPKVLLGLDIPGIGVALTLLIILLTGLIGANVLGQRLVLVWEALLARIPVVKSIYSSVKQVSDTLFSSSSHAFRKALLVQYPRQGAWTIAFLTGKPGGDAARHLSGDYISIYVPTTPNPTSGFFLMVPRADVIELEMSVDEALKYVISMGVVTSGKKADIAELAPVKP
ncbi:DUF502 domain-containing protein [Denitromonas ohlonensis]|jgi:uncharacterized membrane protein|uniref:DUF502 domain-containing protein n=2 Tax=Denitromonas TaxID=139331 RepID=A0A557RCK5_9RHOO|nr:DUF502 domain-containing protein [Denitromonas ohlonensis]TVT49036.1 MAG: DUF502 domain-containing protein [Denitromonas halophila]TVO62858.1 DUF502 domain-containing protein [Denitromonas ohlonensis]TVO75025.1 DUF502 domain-containing protein [Denitromonas ohlonensis]TVT73408.1 MAG: DUF502 domain-containing protein [Denitromonas halophila]TVT75982.1 MAG: DUF502 domain-containing protein [Denitromonas halophila]